jgi:hypothetical protein
LLSHRNFCNNLENTVSIEFLEAEKAALSKTVKNSVLENSKVSSLRKQFKHVFYEGFTCPTAEK